MAATNSLFSITMRPPLYLLYTMKKPATNRKRCVEVVINEPTNLYSLGKPAGTKDVCRVQYSAPSIETIAQSPAMRVPHGPDGNTMTTAITR